MSPDGVEMTKNFEGCRLEAYQDQVGVWTIGYGHTLGVKPGDVWSQQDADIWLERDLERAMDYVAELVKVPLDDHQWYALVDFVFNLGHGALYGSTLLLKLNRGDYAGAALEFPKWNKVRINASLMPSTGLTRRRLAEQAMFLGKDWRAQ